MGKEQEMLIVASSRFGELQVPAGSVIEFPAGIIGFPHHKRYIMVEQRPPFCWLQSVDDQSLAFVVVDGLEFGEAYQPDPPSKDSEIELQPDDEYALLVIVTVRPDPSQTTANLKAPVFVNLRNHLGVQVIYDDPKLSTRFPLWSVENETDSESKQPSEDPNKGD